MTVAEGIETADQADRMRALGCTYGQGFLFARPLQPDALEERLRSTELFLRPAPLPRPVPAPATGDSGRKPGRSTGRSRTSTSAA